MLLPEGKFNFLISSQSLDVRGEHSVGENTEGVVQYDAGSWFRGAAVGRQCSRVFLWFRHRRPLKTDQTNRWKIPPCSEKILQLSVQIAWGGGFKEKKEFDA